MADIDHQQVESSTINTVGYDPEKRELHIDFHDSGAYIYHDVPQHIYEGLMMSGSKGKYLHMHIKGRHAHQKI